MIGRFKPLVFAGCAVLLFVLVIGLVLNGVSGTQSVGDWVASHPTETETPLLIDLNTALLNFFLQKIGIKAEIHMTKEYSPNGTVISEGEQIQCDDLRDVIHPKRQNNILNAMGLEKPYFQVFSPKHGFKSDLSIMDLLFNEGPDSILFLKKL